jgi:thiol-disulfide isomerase/thioredoxin
MRTLEHTMNLLMAIASAVALVAVTTVLGLVVRARTGRLRRVRADTVVAHELSGAAVLGSRATLLQFSTEFCAPCRTTHGLLQRQASARDGVVHLDVDLTRRPELARRFNILQTPTTFVLDGAGMIRARIGGAPRPTELASALDELIGESRVDTIAR